MTPQLAEDRVKNENRKYFIRYNLNDMRLIGLKLRLGLYVEDYKNKKNIVEVGRLYIVKNEKRSEFERY